MQAPLTARLPGRAAGEEIVGVDGLVEPGVGYQVTEGDATFDDEVGDLGQASGPEGYGPQMASGANRCGAGSPGLRARLTGRESLQPAGCVIRSRAGERFGVD